MEQSEFVKVNFFGADFSGRDLRGSIFRGCDLRQAKFIGANLEGASFLYCDVRGTNFGKANMTGVNMTGSVYVDTPSTSDEQQAKRDRWAAKTLAEQEALYHSRHKQSQRPRGFAAWIKSRLTRQAS